MASEKLIQRLSGAWAVAEGRSRKYQPGSFRPLPVTPEAQAAMDDIAEVQRYALKHTDRQVAAAFPDVVKRSVTYAEWEKIKPSPAHDAEADRPL